MKRRWKSWFLALTWVFLSLGTSVFIILMQGRVAPATEPLSGNLENITLVKGEISQISDTPQGSMHERIQISQNERDSSAKPEESELEAENQSSDDSKQPQAESESGSDKNDENQTESSPREVNGETDSKTGETEDDTTTAEEAEKPTPEELARIEKFKEADELFLAGNTEAAEKIYRQLKQPFYQTALSSQPRPTITDPAELPPKGKVYWRESAAGIAAKLETRTLVPLKLLVEEVPEFAPGYIRYAEALQEYGQTQTALKILEQGTTRHPNQPDLVRSRVSALAKEKKFMEASLAARQYAILNPDNPLTPEFIKLADDNLKRYKSYIRGEIRGNAIANVITGAVGYAVTGSLLGPFSALDSALLLLQGEKSIGQSVAKQAKKRMYLVKDQDVTNYVNEIGQKLAKIAGRDEFEYEFFVLPDPELNAFALPGGKVFINAGAIDKAKSEAELAGLIGHELAHTVLSHGFQLVTQGNLISNVTQYLPLGGTIGQLFAMSYSRDMERQADILGTRLIAASGYAADGLRNLMATLEKEQKIRPPAWASSHPGGSERVEYLEAMIANNSYNRYTYEGVGKHEEIRVKIKEIIKQAKACRKDRKKCPDREEGSEGEWE